MLIPLFSKLPIGRHVLTLTRFTPDACVPVRLPCISPASAAVWQLTLDAVFSRETSEVPVIKEFTIKKCMISHGVVYKKRTANLKDSPAYLSLGGSGMLLHWSAGATNTYPV